MLAENKCGGSVFHEELCAIGTEKKRKKNRKEKKKRMKSLKKELKS